MGRSQRPGSRGGLALASCLAAAACAALCGCCYRQWVPPEVEKTLDELPPLEERPGSTDDGYFEIAPSVGYWRAYTPAVVDENPVSGVDLAGSNAGYWLYHLGRFGFFATQALFNVGAEVAGGAMGVRRSEGTEYTTPGIVREVLKKPDAALQWSLREAVATFRQDLAYIKNGYFKEPYDMSPRHRQWSPLFVADQGLRLFREAAGVFRRQAEKADTRAWVGSGSELYPDYYRYTFHYQTDGWLSSDTAKVYETSTENLFLGRQDAMQRTSLVHIAKHLSDTGASRRGEGVRLLEVACGTGRVMTFVRDNWPGMDVTASDLSPFLLEEARNNNAYWQDNFAPGSGVGRASFVQANAEKLPFEDESFDVVLSVYLFHELPAEAQDAVVAEAARVLAPGGVFVLTDSTQLGDIEYFDPVMGSFKNLAEPHYEAYIRRDLAKLALSHGLQPKAKEVNSRTKSLSFVKPPLAPEA